MVYTKYNNIILDLKEKNYDESACVILYVSVKSMQHSIHDNGDIRFGYISHKR